MEREHKWTGLLSGNLPPEKLAELCKNQRPGQLEVYRRLLAEQEQAKKQEDQFPETGTNPLRRITRP